MSVDENQMVEILVFLKKYTKLSLMVNTFQQWFFYLNDYVDKWILFLSVVGGLTIPKNIIYDVLNVNYSTKNTWKL